MALTLLLASERYTVPSTGLTVRAFGVLKVAEEQEPSTEPTEPLPQAVTTEPLVSSSLILWFRVSAMYRVPAVSNAMPEGRENRALVPTASTYPAPPLPARVVTVRLVLEAP
jgi:hypothetical protein